MFFIFSSSDFCLFWGWGFILGSPSTMSSKKPQTPRSDSGPINSTSDTDPLNLSSVSPARLAEGIILSRDCLAHLEDCRRILKQQRNAVPSTIAAMWWKNQSCQNPTLMTPKIKMARKSKNSKKVFRIKKLKTIHIF